ncbi:MAG: SsrA-binding protein SmpB [Clostridiales bacterium]|nr:SsrA-binding protein SmpB [Clostridiales bacterium]
MAKIKGVKPLVQNRRARHEYFVEERYECGIELKGTEVKSIRQGKANLQESYARVREGQVFVDGMHISPYDHGNVFNTDPLRPKRLLLHKSEIRKLQAAVARQGYTLIPLQLYLKDSLVKLELGVCRGKRLHDKRDDLAKRDAERDMERAMRQGQRGGREE